MKINHGVIFAVLLATASVVNANSQTGVDTVRDWVSFLASDELKGRANGSPEITLAGDYIASHFEAAGLTAVPGKDTYFQEFNNDLEHPYRNVIGYLQGSDPKLAGEYIILSAHYDHVGNVDGTIFNGADDNASGVAAVLGLAYRLAALKPKRSIVFITWSGEEEGMLGSQFYTSQPWLPLEDAVLNLNFELVGHTGGLGKRQFWITGAEYSTLYSSLKVIGSRNDWSVSRSPFADLQLFWRSDNVSFVRLAEDQETQTLYGIPAHSISTWGQEGHYHKPHDDADALDYENLSGLIAVTSNMVVELAGQPEAVQWRDNGQLRLRQFKDRPVHSE